MNIEKLRTCFQKENEIFMEVISGVFASKSGRVLAQNYILGLLGPAERKNGWQLAESLGFQTPYSLQQFLYRGCWSADELRDSLRQYAIMHMGEPDGVLVVDETGFLKQGKKSCGVKRQYSGTAGKVANCQIGVFLIYASSKGFTFLDRKLYLPEEWLQDRERCKQAGIPENIEFQTKPQQALSMLQEAYNTGAPFNWVTADSVYGDYRGIRAWLESQDKCYVLCVSGKEYVWQGFKQVRVSSLLENLPEDIWVTHSAGDGSKGERIYDWGMIELDSPPNDSCRRCLLVRRSVTKTEEMRAYVCYAPSATPLSKFIEIAGTRWKIETNFAESKSEVGLDQYEVRSYSGWYKHITLACAAHILLTVLHIISGNSVSSALSNPSSYTSLDEFKKGRSLPV